jgi:hypothetical protein
MHGAPLADSRNDSGKKQEDTAKKAELANAAKDIAEAVPGTQRGEGASRGASPPRGNRARNAARKAEEEAKAASSLDEDVAQDADEDKEDDKEDDEETRAAADEIFWKHLAWGAYQSKKRRDES